jgi:hypothetical protein
MAVIIRDLTDCYKCGAPIMAERGVVHPLCSECDTSFMAWFNAEVEKLG